MGAGAHDWHEKTTVEQLSQAAYISKGAFCLFYESKERMYGQQVLAQ